MYDDPNLVPELKNLRKHPTPEKIQAITDALIYFGLIDNEKELTSKIAELSVV